MQKKLNKTPYLIQDIFLTHSEIKNLTGNEPLASLEYNKEVEIKNKIIRQFWMKNELPGIPDGIILSPRPRNYRTTSKRKIFIINNKIHLKISQFMNDGLVDFSTIEPVEHAEIFKKAGELLNKPVNRAIGMNLNFVIIRGSYNEFSVILNLKKANPQIFKKVKDLSLDLNIPGINIVSMFIYIDPTGSKYYFETKIPKDSIFFKKIFGKDMLNVTFGKHKYFYHPTSFSQINQSIIETMLEKISNIFNGNDGRLLDLYCGYGLFSYYFADKFREILGIDYEGESIISAKDSLQYKKTKASIKFISENINRHSILKILPPVNMNEVIILDPPRQGTKEGVIETITMRNPEKILHIFCGIDTIPLEYERYYNYGYKIKKIVPLDMFPGTPNFEMMVLFEK
jgi:tRNA/tmRNA/rRNA uracil-C5-methylase (TrmA/RlmC/RlmD family)